MLDLVKQDNAGKRKPTQTQEDVGATSTKTESKRTKNDAASHNKQGSKDLCAQKNVATVTALATRKEAKEQREWNAAASLV
jgi:hypothetical protein